MPKWLRDQIEERIRALESLNTSVELDIDRLVLEDLMQSIDRTDVNQMCDLSRGIENEISRLRSIIVTDRILPAGVALN